MTAPLRLIALSSWIAACSAGAAKPPPPPPKTEPTCPATQPELDSSCESFAVGKACLYAEASIGCECVATSEYERIDDRPWTRIWRCGEHGE